MYVVFHLDGTTKDYHVDDTIDQDRELDRLSKIEWVQADGHELDTIQQMFIWSRGGYSIPMPHGPVCRWYGDIARTIHCNLISDRRFPCPN